MHQQNMLQDQIRTGTYYAAILENTADFQGKTIMDVGAGSGILSLFAAQVPHYAEWLAAGALCNRTPSRPSQGESCMPYILGCRSLCCHVVPCTMADLSLSSVISDLRITVLSAHVYLLFQCNLALFKHVTPT